MEYTCDKCLHSINLSLSSVYKPCFYSAQAQLHTIAYSKPFYKIKEVTEQTDTKIRK